MAYQVSMQSNTAACYQLYIVGIVLDCSFLATPGLCGHFINRTKYKIVGGEAKRGLQEHH